MWWRKADYNCCGVAGCLCFQLEKFLVRRFVNDGVNRKNVNAARRSSADGTFTILVLSVTAKGYKIVVQSNWVNFNLL